MPKAPAPPANDDANTKALKDARAGLRSANIPRAPKPPPLGRQQAKLGIADSLNPGEQVQFGFNPAAIVISHTASVSPSAGRSPNKKDEGDAQSGPGPTNPGDIIAMNVEERERARGTTTINLSNLVFDGKDVQKKCMLLLSWTHFSDADDTGSADKSKLPKLKFIWGPQIYLVHLNQATITYTKFSQSGLPVRATVNLTLHSIPKIPGPTNPSSGGLPERRAHLLTGSEGLPSLATRFYGRPGHWRQIAAANGIDDPLRVRPGTIVYLPNPRELTEG